jgi:uncharacterized protein
MTMLHPPKGGVLKPEPTAVTEAFWAGCRRGSLLFQRCTSCGEAMFPPGLSCRSCSADESLIWEASAGLGTLYSWSTVWRSQNPGFAAPYVAAIVELDEGYFMLSNLVRCDTVDVHRDMRLEVTFHVVDDWTFPYFMRDTGAEG